MWIIDFVNEDALKEFEALPNDIKARMSRIIKILEIKGNTLGEPHTANLGDGFLKSEQNQAKGLQEVFIAIKSAKES